MARQSNKMKNYNRRSTNKDCGCGGECICKSFAADIIFEDML